MKKLLEWLFSLFTPQTPQITPKMPQETPKEPQTPPSEILYKTAKSLIGKNLAPGNEKLGCAISMSAVHNKAFPDLPPLRFVNTTEWYKWMKERPDLWEEVGSPIADCVIVSVTNKIPAGSPLKHGHIGIVGRINSEDGTPYIMSNDGDKRCWNTQFTLKIWRDYYQKYGRVPTFYFKRI